MSGYIQRGFISWRAHKKDRKYYSFDALILFFEGAQSEIIKIKRTYLLLKRLFFLRNLSEFDADKVLKIN